MTRPEITRKRLAGFSLIEMTTTIALTGILAVGLANLLQHPMNGFAAVSRRTELVALGDLAITRMTRDLGRALPNSIRVSADGRSLEFLLTSTGGRYRSAPGINSPGPSQQEHTDATDILTFGGDASFNLLGRFQNLPIAYGTNLPNGTRLAVYPTGTDIWSQAATNQNPSAITPDTTSVQLVDDGDEDQLRLSAPHTFSFESPSRRFYVVDTPVSYLCDSVDASLWRITRYAVSSGQPLNRGAPPLSGGSLARTTDLIETCRFAYSPGTASRAGLVSLELVLASAGERVRLIGQVQVRNAP